MVKTGGIICDDYKVSTFEKELANEGFKVISKTPNQPFTTLLKVEYNEEDESKITELIKKIDNQCKAIRN